jgi:hypothetical protein
VIDNINEINNNIEIDDEENIKKVQKEIIKEVKKEVEEKAIKNIYNIEKEDIEYEYRDLLYKKLLLYFDIIYSDKYDLKILTKTKKLINCHIDIEKNNFYFYKNNIHENNKLEIDNLEQVDVFIDKYTLYNKII